MKYGILICSLIYLIFLLSGCDINSPESPDSFLFNSPDCRIVGTEMIFPDFGFTKMKVTVENLGDGPAAYDIGCYVRLKKGNYIADESSAYFGYLDHNESKTEEIWFTKVKTENEYSEIEIVLYWYDAEENYYSADY